MNNQNQRTTELCMQWAEKERERNSEIYTNEKKIGFHKALARQMKTSKASTQPYERMQMAKNTHDTEKQNECDEKKKNEALNIS